MVNLYPSLYRIVSCSCGSLTTIPFDLLQTKIISNKQIEFKLEEFKFLFFMVLLFSLQNEIYNLCFFIKKHKL